MALNAGEVNVYPNPFKNAITVTLDNISPGAVFEMFDALGRKVMNITLKDDKTFVNTAELPGGAYTYRIRSSSEFIKHGKLIKD
jgi:hypothetical protein